MTNLAIVRESNDGTKVRHSYTDDVLGFLFALDSMANFLMNRVRDGQKVIPATKGGYYIQFENYPASHIAIEYDAPEADRGFNVVKGEN